MRKRTWTKITAAQAFASLCSTYTLATKEVAIQAHRYEEGWMVFVYERPKRGKQRLLGFSEYPFDDLSDAFNSALADVGGFQREAGR